MFDMTISHGKPPPEIDFPVKTLQYTSSRKKYVAMVWVVWSEYCDRTVCAVVVRKTTGLVDFDPPLPSGCCVDAPYYGEKFIRQMEMTTRLIKTDKFVVDGKPE